jgi:hypothetical protein
MGLVVVGCDSGSSGIAPRFEVGGAAGFVEPGPLPQTELIDDFEDRDLVLLSAFSECITRTKA